ncbi:hypothetical protein [Sulfurovum sp.]|uniref:hypothetical protein n=1 Tax=Sulfurovum sp. TaxID=1969726 RepID=UPI00356AE442
MNTRTNIGLFTQQQLQELQIIQVAEFYNMTLDNLEYYRHEGYPMLEQQASNRLMHWKNELHRLILGRLA